MKTLLLAEHDNKVLKESTAKALSCATALQGEVDLLVVGKACRPVAEQAAQLAGVARVLLAEADCYEHMLAEPVAALIVALAAPYDAIVAPSTSSGRNIMPRVWYARHVRDDRTWRAYRQDARAAEPRLRGRAQETAQGRLPRTCSCRRLAGLLRCQADYRHLR